MILIDKSGPVVSVPGVLPGFRVWRGSSRATISQNCRGAVRNHYYPTGYYTILGLRIVLKKKI